MLVLSRRVNEKIVFPDLGTSVEVVSVKPGVVRLGIEAPPEVTVLRAEILGQAQKTGTPPGEQPEPMTGHQFRNRLNIAAVGLGLLRRQLQAGLIPAAESTLDRIDREFEALRGQIDPPKPMPRPSRRALLVEDDPNECELLAGFLRMAGLEVDTAEDGTDAMDYLRKRGKPDVVLLDMVMPRCDGPATVQAIRDDPAFADLRIYAVSGHTPDRFPLAEGSRGVDRWFHKPINPEVLLQDLRKELLIA